VARLVPTEEPGNPARHEIALHSGHTRVGRAPHNDVLLNDPEVSKSHAEVVVGEDSIILKDLGSSNGTYVNGQAIGEQRLMPGDLVEIGNCTFRFETGSDSRPPSSVTIVAQSPIDRTQVLAASQIEILQPGEKIHDLEELRRRYDRVRIAFEAVGILIETTDIALLCQRILDVTFRLVSAEVGAVLLFDAGEKLVPWATRVRDARKSADMVISRTIVDQVIRDRAAVLASDALTDSRWSSSESLVLSGVRSLMCVPLVSSDSIFGLLHVANSSRVSAFSQTDLELLSGIGSGAGVALSNAFMAHRLAEAARTRESLGRFLSPVLVEQVLQNRVDLKRGGELREVTVMFADIRGFTSLTERSKAQDVVSLLNEYFDQMIEVVFQRSGVLDKYIGDALMAVWGTPVQHPEDAKNAVAAAREMQEMLSLLNATRRRRGCEPIAIGIGLASGPCVSGAIGARKRMEYTVIGDAVNLGSRLADMARPGEVLCDEETYKRAGRPAGRELPAAQVKGKHKPVPVFQVYGGRSD
jgi:adenylate cyclase